jgi:hypothetical protein
VLSAFDRSMSEPLSVGDAGDAAPHAPLPPSLPPPTRFVDVPPRRPVMPPGTVDTAAGPVMDVGAAPPSLCVTQVRAPAVRSGDEAEQLVLLLLLRYRCAATVLVLLVFRVVVLLTSRCCVCSW